MSNQCGTDINARKRWYQFSIRTVLAATLIMASILAWLGWELHRISRQRTAIAKLRHVGFVVSYEHERLPNSIFYSESSTPPGPAWLRNLLGDDFFATPEMVAQDPDQTPVAEYAAITDADLAYLDQLPDLRILNLNNCNITDRSVERIVLLDKLELLLIQDAMITDAGIDRLREELPDCKIRR